jgi:hypothetical protein
VVHRLIERLRLSEEKSRLLLLFLRSNEWRREDVPATLTFQKNVRKLLRQCVGQPLVADLPVKAARGVDKTKKAVAYSPLAHIGCVLNSAYLLDRHAHPSGHSHALRTRTAAVGRASKPEPDLG